ncbi:MAG: hypothetical protein ACLT16_11400 [[Clostridium] innocuum]
MNTCYVRGDTLCFEPRFTVHSETMELDAAQEVYRVECRYTIQDLIGNVQTAACDGFTEKKAVQEKYRGFNPSLYPKASQYCEAYLHKHNG